MANQPPQLLSASGLAARASVELHRILGWVRRGELAALGRTRRELVFAMDAVEQARKLAAAEAAPQLPLEDAQILAGKNLAGGPGAQSLS